MSNPKKVIVLGGGVAGLSAAHELIERGFDVEIYELKNIPGGKCRSMPVPGSHTDNRKDLPGEHGFRFFPGFYRHVTDTMKRIPFDGNAEGVFGNLIDATELALARYDKTPAVFAVRVPRTTGDLLVALTLFLTDYLNHGIVIAPDEFLFFTERVWQIMTSCAERRAAEYENISWWDYTEASSKSDEYQKFFVYSLTRTLAALRADQASTRTVGNTFIQLFLTTIKPGVATDRILNGPSNDVWITPWLDYLKSRRVKYNDDCRVTRFNCQGMGTGGGQVDSITISHDTHSFNVTGDYYIACVPVEVMAGLIDQALLTLDPGLAKIQQLAGSVDWMNGIQFYLNRVVPVTKGHVAYVDSQWRLTSVSQHQFWPQVDLREYGDGNTREILSVVISEWDQPGLSGKKAKDCHTREEIKNEVWAQMKKSLNVGGVELLRDEYLTNWFLDPDIERLDAAGQWTNSEPLFVNIRRTLDLRPEATTRVPNLFLASDYVRTETDIACMEAANEAARRAVNAIIAADGGASSPCQLWPLREPESLQVFKELDRVRWMKGLPWENPILFPVADIIAHYKSILSLHLW